MSGSGSMTSRTSAAGRRSAEQLDRPTCEKLLKRQERVFCLTEFVSLRVGLESQPRPIEPGSQYRWCMAMHSRDLRGIIEVVPSPEKMVFKVPS
jgi:hypothetical protein